jgi:acyl-CoA thioesterase I
MNRLAVIFVDGTSFFIGLALVLAGSCLFLRIRGRIVQRVSTLSLIIGIVFVVASATPLPLWAYAIWLVACLGFLVVGRSRSAWRGAARARVAAIVVLAAASLALCAAEVPYHLSPRISVAPGQTVYVVGDSLSAGLGGEQPCWPSLLAERCRLPVVNLARPGATCRTAIGQVEGVKEPGSVVLLEIGGNDLLNGTDAAAFRTGIESLLSSLNHGQHRIVMFELPLLPFQNSFGTAQRELAAKHGAALIPKRCLSRVLGMEGGTIDGLHLSQHGHDALAESVAEMIGNRR